jgi:hypothetical protein
MIPFTGIKLIFLDPVDVFSVQVMFFITQLILNP